MDEDLRKDIIAKELRELDRKPGLSVEDKADVILASLVRYETWSLEQLVKTS